MTRRLGDFQLTHALGQGGMGEVWCGFHPKSPWPVAVKLLEIRGPTASATWSPDGVGSSGAFYDEARAAASLWAEKPRWRICPDFLAALKTSIAPPLAKTASTSFSTSVMAWSW